MSLPLPPSPPNRWLALVAVAAGLLLLPGCVLLLPRYANQKFINPPQPPLHGSDAFFGGRVQVEASLLPVRKHHDGPVLNLLLNQPPAENPPEGGHSLRMCLRVTLVNYGSAPIDLRILSVASPLGQALAGPKAVALDPRQQFGLDPVWSSHGKNFQDFKVTIALQEAGTTETRSLDLEPAPH